MSVMIRVLTETQSYKGNKFISHPLRQDEKRMIPSYSHFHTNYLWPNLVSFNMNVDDLNKNV